MAYATTTRSTLRTRLRERLLTTFWSDTELNLYINEALRVWNALTGYNRTSGAVALTASQAKYTTNSAIASNAMFLLRLERTTTHLDPLTQGQLDSFIPSWLSTAAGTPTGWMHFGMNNFILYPQTSGTDNLTAYYVTLAPQPSGDGSYIQIGEEDISAIVDYSTFIARLKESGSEFQESVALLQNFLRQAAKYNSKLLNSAAYARLLGVPQQRQQRPQDLDRPFPR